MVSQGPNTLDNNDIHFVLTHHSLWLSIKTALRKHVRKCVCVCIHVCLCCVVRREMVNCKVERPNYYRVLNELLDMLSFVMECISVDTHSSARHPESLSSHHQTKKGEKHHNTQTQREEREPERQKREI